MKSLIKNPKFWKISLISCLTLVFILSSLPLKSTPGPFEFTDKFEHAFEYFGLGICFMGYFFIVKKNSLQKSGLLTLIWGGLYGIIDEIHQGFVGYFDTGIFSGIRQCDWRDWIADSTGLLLAVLFFSIILKMTGSQQNKAKPVSVEKND